MRASVRKPGGASDGPLGEPTNTRQTVNHHLRERRELCRNVIDQIPARGRAQAAWIVKTDQGLVAAASSETWSRNADSLIARTLWRTRGGMIRTWPGTSRCSLPSTTATNSPSMG